MTVETHPLPGTIVRVDLNEGFRPPEMCKRRPCIVLSPPLPDRPQLCTVVPLSTTAPKRVHAHHMKIQFAPCLPPPYDSPEMWVKGDIVLTVAFHRLRLLFTRKVDGRRVYDIRVLEPQVFQSVKARVTAGLGL